MARGPAGARAGRMPQNRLGMIGAAIAVAVLAASGCATAATRSSGPAASQPRVGVSSALSLAVTSGSGTPSSSLGSVTPAVTPAGGTSVPLPGCRAATLKTLVPGRLTFGTSGGPAAPFVESTPASGRGYESALAYAVAARLGFDRTSVSWVALDLAAAARGVFPKSGGVPTVDVALGRLTAPDAASTAANWSTGYFALTQSVVTLPGAQVAKTLAGLKKTPLVAVDAVGQSTAGSTASGLAGRSVPKAQTLQQAMTVLRSGQAQAAVIDSVSALRAAAAGSVSMVGELPSGRFQPRELGMVAPRGSAISGCVSTAIDTLRAEGALTRLSTIWLAPAGLKPLR